MCKVRLGGRLSAKSNAATQSHLAANIHSRRGDAFRNNIVAHFPLLVSPVNCVHTRGGRRLVCLLCLEISSSSTLSIITEYAAASSPSLACFSLSLLVPFLVPPFLSPSLCLFVSPLFSHSLSFSLSQLSTLLSAPFAFSTLTIHPFGARSLPLHLSDPPPLLFTWPLCTFYPAWLKVFVKEPIALSP